ncbi:MAG TPA: hypothetical protein VGG39_23295 [Polyangiaceae bacterium]|jgi:hypothetical protein
MRYDVTEAVLLIDIPAASKGTTLNQSRGFGPMAIEEGSGVLEVRHGRDVPMVVPLSNVAYAYIK